MKILALDTTTRAGSAALLDDGRVIEERPGDASRTHAERLPTEVVSLLDAHGMTLADVDVYAVASGPGSFTGLRIGIATMQGLAFVGRRRIVGVSALDALAYAASSDLASDSLVGVWMDARRRDVFAALYGVEAAADGRVVTMDGPSVGDPVSILERWHTHMAGRTAAFIGDGADLFRETIAHGAPGARLVRAPLLAGIIGELAHRAAIAGRTLDPAGIQPLYVRRPDAEVARERAAKP